MYSTLVDSQRKMASLIEHLTSMTRTPAQQIHEYPSFIGTGTTTKHTQNTMQTQQSEPPSQISDPISPIFRQKAETNQEWIQQINERATILKLPESTKDMAMDALSVLSSFVLFIS